MHNYNLDEFKKDLVQAGINLSDQSRRVLMPLLDGCLECWAEYLMSFTDVSISMLPNLVNRRMTEMICVFDGKVVKVKNETTCAWEDYNGCHYFTDHLIIYANSEQTIKDILTNFREFLKVSGVDFIRNKTKEILPAWSVAFVHRMPDEVRAFYFLGV